MKKTLALCCIILMALCLASCAKNDAPADLWSSATYTTDTELGEGAKTVVMEVASGEKTVALTIKTDKDTLGDALKEHNLIAGEKSAYGMYVKVVNGMTADYAKDQTYWALYKDGVSLPTGVDNTPIADGEHYEMVYTK